MLMYAAGAAHPFKGRSVRFLERLATGEEDAVLDAEILREVLDRYRALDRWEEGRKVFDLARTLFPVVLPITVEVMDHARALLDAFPHLMARDAVHAAVVHVYDLEAICSFDRDFDPIGTMTRREP